MDRKMIKSGYFITYVSTSWRKEVSKAFMKGDGMIIEIDKKYKERVGVYCCDVSWISKFPDECEILFARSTAFMGENKFKCVILDESNGVQTISLKGSND